MALDLALLGAAALGALAGWRRGFILPLVTIAGTFFGLSALFTGPTTDLVPSGAAGMAMGLGVGGAIGGMILRTGTSVLSLVHRVPVLVAADRTFGLPLGVATGLVGAYVALATLLSVDGFLAPLHGQPSVDAAAVAVMRGTLEAQPQFRLIADPAMLDRMATEMAQSAIPRGDLSKYDSTLVFYEDSVRPHILSSALGPLLIRVGGLLPVVGRPVDYPSK